MQEVAHQDVDTAIVATNIKFLLEQKGWSIRRLAEEAGETPMTISRMASGKCKQYVTACRNVAKAFGIGLDELTDEDLPKKSRQTA